MARTKNIARKGPQENQDLRKKIRDTGRLLRRDNIDSEVRINAERQLKSLNAQLAEAQTKSVEEKRKERYHKVKFFDRQKVTKKMKQAETQLLNASEPGEKEEIRTRINALQVEQNYILHYPNSEKYISLYPTENAADPVSSEKRNRIKEFIKEMMEAGTLENAQEMWKIRYPNENKNESVQDDNKEQLNDDISKDDLKDDEFFDVSEEKEN